MSGGSKPLWTVLTPGQMVLGCIRMQAEQAFGTKTVSSIAPWPHLQVLLPGFLPCVPLMVDYKLEDKPFPSFFSECSIAMKGHHDTFTKVTHKIKHLLGASLTVSEGFLHSHSKEHGGTLTGMVLEK